MSWGVSYYLIGGLGEEMAAALGWSRDLVYGGFTVALLVMGLTSPLAGRLIDRHGGRSVMICGSILNAAGCVMLGLTHSVASYLLAWILLGLGMRLTLYDAAFAALARIAGPAARGPISQITLLGGLASTIFWPIGHYLAELMGWRGALFVYAALALFTILLHLAIPTARHDAQAPSAGAAPLRQPLAQGKRELALAGALYAMLATLANFLNAGMSAHMIAILGGLGVAATISVWIATLRGVGQSLARLCEVLFGRHVDPLTMNLLACLLMPLAFMAGLYSSVSGEAAVAFAFVYGACNGILTITRGTLPLVLFDPRTYGTLVGRLIAPSFILSAVAPLAYAVIIERFGQAWGLYLSLACALAMLASAVALWVLFRRK